MTRAATARPRRRSATTPRWPARPGSGGRASCRRSPSRRPGGTRRRSPRRRARRCRRRRGRPCRPRGRRARPSPGSGSEVAAPGDQRRAQLLGEVVGAQHEHVDPLVGGDRADVEDRRRRLDHRPDRRRRAAGRVERGGDLVERRPPSRPWGSRPPTAPAAPAAARSSAPHGVAARCSGSSARGRRTRPTSPRRRPARGRAALASGATASSRSKMIASHGIVLAFSSARSLAAGMYSTDRRGRSVVAHDGEPVAPRPARGRGRRAASASSTTTLHCLTEASSSILPSSSTAPVPSPIASITRRAWATSSGGRG